MCGHNDQQKGPQPIPRSGSPNPRLSHDPSCLAPHREKSSGRHCSAACPLLAMGRHPAPVPGMTAVRRNPAVRAAYERDPVAGPLRAGARSGGLQVNARRFRHIHMRTWYSCSCSRTTAPEGGGMGLGRTHCNLSLLRSNGICSQLQNSLSPSLGRDTKMAKGKTASGHDVRRHRCSAYAVREFMAMLPHSPIKFLSILIFEFAARIASRSYLLKFALS